MALNKLLNDLGDYLEHEQDSGVTEVEVSPGTLAELARPPVKRQRSAAGAATGLEAIAREVAACTKCSLHETRTKVVPGQGSSAPDILFIGEAPGADEDRQGLAFVGRAGQLLTKMIEAMGYARDDVFIGNILKCRPPENRTPRPDEMETCLPYLKQQIALLNPKVIIALGSTAVKGLFDTKTGITKLRGNWMTFEGIDVMPTYHPAYLLRNPSAKREVWEDLQEVLRHIGRPVPTVKKQQR